MKVRVALGYKGIPDRVLGDGRDRTRSWVGRVVGHDRMLAPAD